MDSLLASYGSDEEDEEEVKVEERELREPRKLSLFGALPPPRHPAFEPLSHSTKVSSAVESLPVVEEEDRKPGMGLFGKLPVPKGDFGRSGVKVKVEVEGEGGGGRSKVRKQVVAFRPPIDASVLDEEDGGWRPGQKRVKTETDGGVAGGGGLQALLPAPKQSLGLGSGLGGGGGGGGGGGRRRAAMDVEAEPVAVNSRMSAPSAARGEAKQAAYGDSVRAADESAAFAPQVPYSNEAYGWTAPQGVYAPAQELPQSTHDVNSSYERQDWQYSGSASYASQSNQASYAPANSAPVSDPVAQVLQAERRRGREDKMAAPAVIEVNQSDLTGGKMREDQLRSTGIAFGPSYQPVSSSKDKPSKIHRRKHQIGTLLHDMKAREMELLDRRAKGSLTKAETQAKYGW